jgi:hypothetical protein
MCKSNGALQKTAQELKSNTGCLATLGSVVAEQTEKEFIIYY